jgi:hypothetical protein
MMRARMEDHFLPSPATRPCKPASRTTRRTAAWRRVRNREQADELRFCREVHRFANDCGQLVELHVQGGPAAPQESFPQYLHPRARPRSWRFPGRESASARPCLARCRWWCEEACRREYGWIVEKTSDADGILIGVLPSPRLVRVDYSLGRGNRGNGKTVRYQASLEEGSLRESHPKMLA